MKTALLSLSDKTGLEDFAARLVNLGWQLIASGGTFRAITSVGLPATPISTITGFPEILNGRVKTLHPAIHGGILARDNVADKNDLKLHHINMIDLVVCNLYPFQKTVSTNDIKISEAIEQIDIGGVTLLRAAAKNFQRVIVVCDPGDYPSLLDGLNNGTIGIVKRKQLAYKAFEHTRNYDAAIANYLKEIS